MPVLRLATVQERGQITIPSEIRRTWRIKKGDVVAFIETEGAIAISPQEVIAMAALDRIGRTLREKGITLDELIESGRDIRGRLLEEEYGLKADDE